MKTASSNLFRFALVPAAALLLAAWWKAGALERRADGLAAEAATLRAELAGAGLEFTEAEIAARRDGVGREAEALRRLAGFSRSLAADTLVAGAADRPFRLIEFERERAAVAQGLRERAAAAKVALAPSAFEVLADSSESPPQPRRRWAQLALARETASRAVAAGVAGYEALPVPAVREIRADKASPILAEEVLFCARVTGTSASVQAFVEHLALGAAPEDMRLIIEHLVLRKDGTSAPDQASATVVVAALLPPAPETISPSAAP